MWLEYRSGHLPVGILRNVRMVEEYEDDKSGILDVRLLHVAIRGVTRCLIQLRRPTSKPASTAGLE